MKREDIELIDILLRVSDQPKISETHISVFTTIFKDLVKALRADPTPPYRKADILLPLLLLQSQLRKTPTAARVRKFQSTLIESFEAWQRALISIEDPMSYSKALGVFFKTMAMMPRDLETSLNHLKNDVLDELMSRQSSLLDDCRDMYLNHDIRKLDLNSSKIKAHQKSISKATKILDTAIKTLFAQPPLNIAGRDEAVELRSRYAAQSLLLENNASHMIELLKSDWSRCSDGHSPAMDVATIYVDITLDRISNSQRSGLRKTRFTEKHSQRQLYSYAFRHLPLGSLRKTSPKLVSAMSALISRRENLTVNDKELRQICKLKIESAMIDRRFSFKGRPKHFNYTDAAQSIRDLRIMLDAANVDFFLMSGTLLGAVREKGFIASDYDIDVGVFDSQANIPDIEVICEASPLFSISEVVGSSIVKVKHTSGIVIDIFIYFEVDGLQCHRGGAHEWYNTPFGLTETAFLGGRYYIPDNHEIWLAENYGNWEKPVLFYDMSYDTPNRDYISTSTAGIYYLWSRAQNAVSNGWASYMAMAFKAMSREFGLDLRHYLPPSPRRSEKFEATKIKTSEVERVLIGSFNTLDHNLLSMTSDDKIGKTVAAVLQWDLINISDGEYLSPIAARLNLAKQIRSVHGLELVETKKDLKAIRKKYKNADIIYIDNALESV